MTSVYPVTESPQEIPFEEVKVHDNKAFDGPLKKTQANNIVEIDDDEASPKSTKEEEEDGPSTAEPLDTNSDFEDIPDDENPNILARTTGTVQDGIGSFFSKYGHIIKTVLIVVSLLAYVGYFTWAMYCSFEIEDDIRLAWMTIAAIILKVGHYINRYFGEDIARGLKHVKTGIMKHWVLLKWLFIGTVIVLLVVIIIVFVALKDPHNLVSGIGIFVLIFLGYIGSHNPKRVIWRPVLWGLLIQFILALLILRTQPGYMLFRFMGDRVTEFLDHTNMGSKFLFGDLYLNHLFAFKILPVIVFFSTAITVLYYLGIIQVVIQVVASGMQACMGTTAAESLNTAANLFVGQSEAPLLIRPFIGKMTNSELHSVMTSGFATIAGSVMAAYIGFGVPANHLLSASVMSAPAALAMSKLFYPETKRSKTTASDVKKMPPSPHKNIIEAASAGASDSIVLVANIAVNLIAFLAILSFINESLTWFGKRACMTTPLTFQLICSYVLWPIALVMGVEIADCRHVGELIGVKTFLNEFIAYDELGKLIKNRELMDTFNASTRTVTYSGENIYVEDGIRNATLLKGYMSHRSEVIATYTLCGFANFGSIGVMVSALGAMAPHRKRNLSTIVLRALIAGNVACFLTACIAGLFYQKSTA